MNSVENCIICWVFNAWNTRWTSQTSRASNCFCQLDLMTSVICYRGCKGLLFFGWKLVSLNKYLITALNDIKNVNCKRLITLRKPVNFPIALFFKGVWRFWRQSSAPGENACKLKLFIVKLCNNYIFQKTSYSW